MRTVLKLMFSYWCTKTSSARVCLTYTSWHEKKSNIRSRHKKWVHLSVPTAIRYEPKSQRQLATPCWVVKQIVTVIKEQFNMFQVKTDGLTLPRAPTNTCTQTNTHTNTHTHTHTYSHTHTHTQTHMTIPSHTDTYTEPTNRDANPSATNSNARPQIGGWIVHLFTFFYWHPQYLNI